MSLEAPITSNPWTPDNESMSQLLSFTDALFIRQQLHLIARRLERFVRQQQRNAFQRQHRPGAPYDDQTIPPTSSPQPSSSGYITFSQHRPVFRVSTRVLYPSFVGEGEEVRVIATRIDPEKAQCLPGLSHTPSPVPHSATSPSPTNLAHVQRPGPSSVSQLNTRLSNRNTREGGAAASDDFGLGMRRDRMASESETPSRSVETFLRLSAPIFHSCDPAVAPYVPLDWEREMYYYGISPDPPELLYRSNCLEVRFPTPTGSTRISTKTACGVFDTPLNAVWRAVAPEIRDILKARKIRYSAIMAARFVTNGGEDGKNTRGPIVIWIGTHLDTTTAEDAHKTSPDILTLLVANGVEGAVVEWYEGTTKKMSGPPLLRVTNDTNPTYDVRRFLTPTLGMPIAPAEREAVDASGTHTLFFHEGQDEAGAPSAKVFGVSNCHVLRADTAVDYEYKDAGTPPQYVRLAGSDRFQRGLDDISARINVTATRIDLLTREITELEEKPKSEDLEDAKEDEVAVVAKREKLAQAKKDIEVLKNFFNDTVSQWRDIGNRNIGHVVWAPKISVDESGYTKDIGTFEVDAARFKAHFKGNVIDLGTKFTPEQLTAMLDPQSTGWTVFEYPTNRQLKITGWLTDQQLHTPEGRSDSYGEPCRIVMKNGNTTDLTVGRCAGLEAYVCDEFDVESIELAIYNYDTWSSSFSEKGDSGSLIVDGQGRMVGILHSGMPREGSNHVTFATPAWWAIEQLKKQYPHADFNRTAF
ncbi:hypothetical protein PENSPDRAFT_636316 [Peniophora sp. CONT]|nr:hypothetical protein PENSPDRAFT_636316 [Peniophora sp. CONT]